MGSMQVFKAGEGQMFCMTFSIIGIALFIIGGCVCLGNLGNVWQNGWAYAGYASAGAGVVACGIISPLEPGYNLPQPNITSSWEWRRRLTPVVRSGTIHA